MKDYLSTNAWVEPLNWPVKVHQGSISLTFFAPYTDLSHPTVNFYATKSFSKVGSRAQFSIGHEPVYEINHWKNFW